MSTENPIDDQVQGNLNYISEALSDDFTVSESKPATDLERNYTMGAADYTRSTEVNLPNSAYIVFSRDQDDPLTYVVDKQCEEGESALLGELLIEGQVGDAFDSNLTISVMYKAKKDDSGEIKDYFEVDPWHADISSTETHNEISRLESLLEEEGENVERMTEELQSYEPVNTPEIRGDEVQGSDWGPAKTLGAD